MTASPTTFKLREGLKYSDGSPVKASDFKHSIERLLEQDSQGAGLGYTTIEGGAEFLESKKGGVPGIETDDARAHDQDHALRAAWRVPLRAGDPVRERRAGRHAGEEHDEDPAPGHGLLRVPGRETQPELHAGQEQELQPVAEGHGSRCVHRRPDQRDDRFADLEPGHEDHPRRSRLHGRQPAAGPRGGAEGQVPGSLPSVRDELDVLLLHEHRGAAVRQPRRFVRRSTTPST